MEQTFATLIKDWITLTRSEVMQEDHHLVNKASREFLQCYYYLDAEIRYAEPFMPTPESRQFFLYLQALMIVNAKANYITRRGPGLQSYLLVFTMEGAGKLVYNEKEETVHAGEGFLIDCSRPHSYQTIRGHWNFVSIHLDGASMQEFFRLFSQNGSVTFSYSSGSKLDLYLRELLGLQGHFTRHKNLLVNRILTDLMTELVFQQKNKDSTNRGHNAAPFVESARDYIHIHFQENLTVDTLAEYFHVSKFHFSREFKRATGYSPYQYLSNYRLNYSKDLLKYSTYSISEIAEKSGFSSQQNFQVFFKNKEHCSPSFFRKSFRN